MKQPRDLAVEVVSTAARVLAASDRLDEVRGYHFKSDSAIGGGGALIANRNSRLRNGAS